MDNNYKNNKVESESTCPYCKKVLEKKPKQKKKCPFCNNFIYVRDKMPVTEDEAKTIDAIKVLENYGITRQDFDNHKSSFKFKISNRDAIWSLFNKLLHDNMEANNFGTLNGIYYNMALMLNKEGEDCFTYLYQANKMELMRIKQQSVQSSIIKGVRISTCGINSCEDCKELDGKVFTIEEALEKMPIPSKDCTNKLFNDKYPFCRCSYITELFENNEQRKKSLNNQSFTQTEETKKEGCFLGCFTGLLGSGILVGLGILLSLTGIGVIIGIPILAFQLLFGLILIKHKQKIER